MGDPRKSRRKWIGPNHPWRRERLQQEIVLLGKYGLRNKRELWLANTIAREFRYRARKLLGLSEELRRKDEELLLKRLVSMGYLPEGATLDDVLSLTADNILERRLQTIVYKKGLARSIYQARQLIVHGHIVVKGRRVYSPGYLVSREEEPFVDLAPNSPFRKAQEEQAA